MHFDCINDILNFAGIRIMCSHASVAECVGRCGCQFTYLPNITFVAICLLTLMFVFHVDRELSWLWTRTTVAILTNQSFTEHSQPLVCVYLTSMQCHSL